MTITISINIQMEPDDLAALANGLAQWWWFPSAPPTTPPPSLPPKAPKPPKPPKSSGTPVLVPDVPTSAVAHEIAAIPSATEEAKATEPEPTKARNTRPREPLPFDEFDRLVKKEIKRLGMDRRIPNAKLWDAERDERLPTYAAVMYRYGCTNLDSFAEKMGMQPPLSPKRFPDHKEATHAATA